MGVSLVREVMVKFMYKGWITPKVIHIYYFLLSIKKTKIINN